MKIKVVIRVNMKKGIDIFLKHVYENQYYNMLNKWPQKF